MNKVFSIVRQTCGRSPTDDLKDLDVNIAVWSIFMSVTLQAAVHLGKDYTDNLRTTKNQPLKSVRHLFQTTERSIKDQTEITGLTTINWKQPMRKETCLLCDRDVHLANSKTYVFSDSVLGLGNISDKPIKAWTGRIKWVFGNAISKIWIGSTESRWSSSGKISQDSRHGDLSLRFKR